MKDNKDKLEITELFSAKAGNDWSRCFHGTIRRLVDAKGIPYVFGKIKVRDGYISVRSKDQWELGEELDELVLMVLDYGLNENAGEKIEISGEQLFLN